MTAFDTLLSLGGVTGQTGRAIVNTWTAILICFYYMVLQQLNVSFGTSHAKLGPQKGVTASDTLLSLSGVTGYTWTAKA